ncbi:MAG: hypothetical protein JRI47_07955, partial [Deltaproteobacteria bacterium]|nr:hypothetical protein [Deltaproteobacteria bacterium]
RISQKRADVSALMFLADWFRGYHEFHLSIDRKDQSQKLALWDTEKGPWHLSRKQSIEAYRQAAFILTLYYDVDTFEQIFPWHHAAGDFVVKTEQDALDVRLVTARQYAPMIDPNHDMPPTEALLFFLLNLSLRMRMDRIDGTGPVAWAENMSVDATLKGFMEGLREKERGGTTDAGFVHTFLRYCGSLSEEDLSERFQALVDACDPSAPDIPVMRAHLAEHISKFCSVFQDAFAKTPF